MLPAFWVMALLLAFQIDRIQVIALGFFNIVPAIEVLFESECNGTSFPGIYQFIGDGSMKVVFYRSKRLNIATIEVVCPGTRRKLTVICVFFIKDHFDINALHIIRGTA